ncbi:phosphoglycerate mutase-like protein [Sodiomyces alkalinus F11]|uniref:Phosphoglycerate mutase-like protein n=1 Tax=Sodiomyces alkalinus (strain CBS 110278 / VKM F-3762 / F11) TaxID=1314773 RepID=A0A3N2Q2H6_SODAK|nr:phosphoglycerate mutase-like protein [Sodiomyces alkalinus F11]ROT40932.1 phosphoglycerate mutase-like protein [Sodiomyces alkalinus F11]
MPPTLVLIRHAQALHNANNKSNPQFQRPTLNPDLTSLGVEQCEELRKSLVEHFADVRDAAIIVSPMRRTIQTALLSLDWLLERGTPIQADARWQDLSPLMLMALLENSGKPCDTGTPVTALAREFPVIDYSTLDPVYPDKTSPAGAKYAYNRKAILSRGQSALESLRQRPEKFIFVVSHSGFLRLGLAGYWFFNADYRVFDLESDGSLKQWESTASGGLGKSLTVPVPLGFELPEEDIEMPPENA